MLSSFPRTAFWPLVFRVLAATVSLDRLSLLSAAYLLVTRLSFVPLGKLFCFVFLSFFFLFFF